MVFALVALELDMVAVTPALIGFALLLLLGEYALYRARRYRLTRTVFRGLRSTSTARRGAMPSMRWFAGASSLSRSGWLIRGRRLHRALQDAQHQLWRSARPVRGQGLALFWRGLPIWLLVVGGPIIAIVVMARLIDWNMLGNALAPRRAMAIP